MLRSKAALACVGRLSDSGRMDLIPPSDVAYAGVVTGELRAKVDRIWVAFWSGGIANPLEVMVQITDLLFIRRLGEVQAAKENKANRRTV